MALSMRPAAWLSVIQRDYLQEFIRQGGAAVKFAVPLDGLEAHELVAELRHAAEAEGYFFVALDAATTRAHMIERLFYEVAQQVDWDDLARAFLVRALSDLPYLLPAQRGDLTLESIASLNGLGLGEMRAVINGHLQTRLLQDYAMTHEFRTAMRWLCLAQLDPEGASGSIAEAVKEWLRGELRLISALKPAAIFQKIGRHNGRHMLSSLSYWLHAAGKAGLVLTLDISRLLEVRGRDASDGLPYYTTPAVLDGYEVLRQFIDGTDEMRFSFIVALAPPSFLVDERRGLRAYGALQLRIWDEVHDRQRPNPLAPLIRLSREPEADLV